MSGIEYEVLELILLTSLAGLIVLGAILLIGLKMLKGGSKRDKGRVEEETQMIQELFQGLSRMESRVESLETLLFDREYERGRRNER